MDRWGTNSGRNLPFGNSQPLSHFFVEEALAWAVRLNPFAINHELRNGPFASTLDDLFGGAGGGFDVDFPECQVVALEEALGFAAVGAPEGRIENDVRGFQSFRVSRSQDCVANNLIAEDAKGAKMS